MRVANTTKSERGSLGGREGEFPQRGIEGEMECGQAGNSLAGVWGGNPMETRPESKQKVLPLKCKPHILEGCKFRSSDFQLFVVGGLP